MKFNYFFLLNSLDIFCNLFRIVSGLHIAFIQRREAVFMTKIGLINKLAKEAGITVTEARSVVNTFFSSLSESLSDNDKVELRGFGTFTTKLKKGRRGRNPKTGAQVDIPSKIVPHFKPGRKLKDLINS
jgi:integration host factor subunit beta